jgi:AcrR family transcriptional regulator
MLADTDDAEKVLPAPVFGIWCSTMLTAEEIDARRHAARRRELIERSLPEVEALLARGGGFLNVTLEEILASAGMSRTSFYRYFTDKNELLVALIEPVIADVLLAAARPMLIAPPVTLGELERVMRETIAIYAPHVDLLGAMVEVAAYDSVVNARFRAGFDAASAQIAEGIRSGQRDGYIRTTLHPDEMAGWITWMSERGMSQLVRGADDATLDRLASSVAAILWHTFYDIPQ